MVSIKGTYLKLQWKGSLLLKMLRASQEFCNKKTKSCMFWKSASSLMSMGGATFPLHLGPSICVFLLFFFIGMQYSKFIGPTNSSVRAHVNSLKKKSKMLCKISSFQSLKLKFTRVRQIAITLLHVLVVSLAKKWLSSFQFIF